MSQIPLQVRHIIRYLETHFGSHIDLSDLASAPEGTRTQAFRTRALTALAVQRLVACSDKEAASAVVDGFGDHGIDGVAVDSLAPQIWIIQTKWSDQGKATTKQDAKLKLGRGLEKVQDLEFDDFGPKFARVSEALADAIETPGVQIQVVVATLGDIPESELVDSDLQRVVDNLNVLEPLATVKKLRFADFYNQIRASVAWATRPPFTPLHRAESPRGGSPL